MRTAQVLRRLSFADWGGTETVVWETARRLFADGHDPRILATRALCSVSEETREGLRVRRFPCVYPSFPMTRALRASLDRKAGNPYVPALHRLLLKEPFELIHCHAMGRMAQMCLSVARRRGIPCVLSLHGGALNVPVAEAAALAAPTRGRIPWGGVLDRLIGWRKPLPQAMDGVVCVGADEADALRERFPKLRVLHLPNGVDAARFARPEGFDARAVRARWGIPRDARLMLCAARVDPQKGQRLLLELLARRRAAGEAVVLVLAGPVTVEAYAAELRRETERLGVAAAVVFTGALAPGSAELTGLYHAADAFVLASRHEPFGIVALEAWAAGVPLIAADVGGLGRLVRTGETALTFPSGDADALERAWVRLFSEPGLREALCANGLLAVREYGWEALARRLESFYRELVATGVAS